MNDFQIDFIIRWFVGLNYGNHGQFPACISEYIRNGQKEFKR